MDREERLYHLIDQYLEDSLVGEELDILKNRMKNDESFVQQVALQKALREELILQREAELKAVLAKAVNGKNITPLWSSVWAKAAVAILVGSMGIFTLLLFLNPSGNLAQKKQSNESYVSEIEKDLETKKGEEINLLDSSVKDEEVIENEETKTLNENANLPEKIMIVEDSKETSEIGVSTGRSDAKRLTNLRDEADQLEVDDDVEVKKDKLLGKRVVVSKVILLDQNISEKDAKGQSLDKILIQKKEKKRLFKRKKEVEDEEEKDIAKPAKPSYKLSSGKEINVEYWKNILNFKGYKYMGNTIVLYGLNHEGAIRVFEYMGAMYLKHNGLYYRIRITSKHLPFELVNNTELIEMFSKF